MERRVTLSGGSVDAETQFCLEVKTLSSTDRQNLLKGAGVTTALDATQTLAIKAELSLPWYRLRLLRTYENIHSIH